MERHTFIKNLKLHRWDLVKKILPADPVDGNRFGYTVSISNDLVVVGSYQAKNEDGQRTGAAYIFQRDHGGADNWGQVKKIIGSDTKGLDQFGRYVCVEGDIMTVTAFGSMPRKVYIFQKDVGGSNNWGEVKKITEPSDSYFGFSLAVQGDLILVGAPKDDEGAVWAGAIYVFQKDEGGSNNWGEVKKIIAFDADEKDNFGESISISGDMLLIGASGEFSGGSEPGSAYLYQRDLGGSDNWGVLKKLVGKDVLPSDNFGVSLCINFDAAIIGASRENDGGLRAGAAYIFQKNHGGSNNWGQVKKLKASDPEAYDFFGMSVSLSGDAAIVGAYGGDHVHSEDGLSYIFPSVTDTTAPTLFAGDTMKNQYEVAIEGFQTIEDLLANNGLVSDNIAIDSLSFASIDTFVRQATFEKCPVIDTINIRYKISDISGLSDTCALIILRIDTIPPKIDLGDTLILPRDSFPKVPLSIDELVANGGLVFDNHSLDSASFRIIDTLISHSNICNSSDTIRIRLSINDYCGLSDTCSLFVIRSQMTNPDTIPITACNSFIVPSGDETYYTSGIYADTIQGANGCDSLITVDLTITDDPLVCGISLCQQSISISEEFLASDQHQTIFHAVLDLTATGIITLSESLVFKSGNSIELKPIFEVSEGAELTLYIEECPE